ncbi:RHS repeat domain-containing protein [Chitinophaga lutea]|uniref:RHS repeat protein n=1 Tax=Chitinophaga lutea TaxID=2488634 RepID=UPI000F4E6A6A|nr:RHS repeat protein [Chitinophaga lutea]
MSVKKTTATVILLLALVNIVPAQQKINIESLIPPSPNAAELGKYGQIPVGLNTGVPDISFPLYEVKSGNLSFPITLSYHASGNQVNQRVSDVGMGWIINAGGQISRSVNGIADDATGQGAWGYFNYVPPGANTIDGINHHDSLMQYIQDYFIPISTTVQGTTVWGRDLEPDMFHYNIPGKSGKFIYTKARSFMTIPFEPIEIEKFLDNSNKVCFRLTSDNGAIFNFSQYTVSKFLSGYPSTCTNLTSYISTWQLSSIISANLTDTITFEYEVAKIHDEIEQHVKTIGLRLFESPNTSVYCLDGIQILDTELDPCSGYGKIKKTNVDYDELRIKRINFKNGYVLFNRNSGRNDVPAVELSTNRALDNIEIYDANNVLTKKFLFGTEYAAASPTTTDSWKNNRLRLKKFSEVNIASPTDKKEYTFEYETTPLPHYGSYNIDYWGYSNGQSNTELIPYASYSNTTFQSLYLGYLTGSSSITVENRYSFTSPNNYTVGTANREPSASHMMAGMLKKIIFPTGGYTQFEFEPHKYWSFYTSQQAMGGGLRVKSIKTYTSPDAMATQEFYKYGENDNGLGILVLDEGIFYKNYDDYVGYYPTSFRAQCMYNESEGNLFAWKRNFQGISKYSSPSFNGSPVVYQTASLYKDGSGTNGKSVYKFDVNLSYHELIPSMFASSGNYGSINNAWHQGELLEEKHYKFENNQYYPVSRTKHEYITYNAKVETAVIFKQVITPVTFGSLLLSYPGYQTLTPDQVAPVYPNLVRSYGLFGIYPYSITTGAYRKFRDSVTTYDATDTSRKIDVVTQYAYENAENRYLTKTERNSGSGEFKISRFKYPQDHSDVVSQSMVARNILTPVLEEKEFILRNGNEELLSTIQTNFRQTGNLIVKDRVNASTLSNTPETRILFNQYDSHGNIVEQQKANDVKEVYLWGYNSQYPVAKITNTTYDVAKTYINQSVLDNPADDTTLRSHLGNLRNIPGAFVTIFTYKPLIGVTSETDTNGRTVYYSYDNFGRLSFIKDHEGKILKMYSYKFSE